MEGMLLLSGATGVLVALGLVESHAHRRCLAKIPIRIHVNGTRGKSSVTRLIAAGLRAGGLRTCAKTTGTLPRLILPDGSEEPIERLGRANIIEQVSVTRRVAGLNVDALVVECMAVNPLLQAVCERQVVRSTHGVLTNVRPDHLDQMGPTVTDVARALCGTMPIRGRLYTAEEKHLDVVRHAARDRQSEVIAIEASDPALVSPVEMLGFSYLEHPENVALALRVCEDFGVSRASAIFGMHHARPDFGAATVNHQYVGNVRLLFVNAFAANDPESTGSIWKRAVEMLPRADVRSVIVNCRDDRSDRSLQLAQLCSTLDDLDWCAVVGSGCDLFIRSAVRFGFPRNRILTPGSLSGPALLERLAGLCHRSGLVVGIGNIAGSGLELTDHFAQELPVSRPMTPVGQFPRIAA